MNIEYIAKEAGVSKSAVSFALNGKPGISQETRERIIAIAKQYGYAPKFKASAETPAYSYVPRIRQFGHRARAILSAAVFPGTHSIHGGTMPVAGLYADFHDCGYGTL